MKMREEKAVKELWWEGSSLHIIDEDDKHTVYEDAYITSQSSIPSSSDCVEVKLDYDKNN